MTIVRSPLRRDTPKSLTVNFSVYVSKTLEKQFQDFYN